MPGAVLLTIAGIAGCLAGAALLGWAIDLVQARRKRRVERDAAPARRMLDAGDRHDLRALARRTATERVRVGGARR